MARRRHGVAGRNRRIAQRCGGSLRGAVEPLRALRAAARERRAQRRGRGAGLRAPPLPAHLRSAREHLDAARQRCARRRPARGSGHRYGAAGGAGRKLRRRQRRKADLGAALPHGGVNRWRSAFPAAGAWLLLLEPGRACLALQSGGRWRSLHNARGAFASSAELATLLERERHQVDGEVPELVLLHRGPPAGAALQAPGWRLQALPYVEGRFGPLLAAA